MRTNQLMLYKNMEHGKLLQDMTFLMENCENDYYNKRNHQDNLGVYNNNYQYCPHCGQNVKFEYDRCTICKNN